MAERQETEASIVPGVPKKGVLNFLKQTCWYLKRSFVYWTWEARKFWAMVLCVVGVVLIVALFPQEEYLRYTGLLYQLIGFFVVGCALWSREKAFGIPSAWPAMMKFAQDRPWFWGKGVVVPIRGFEIRDEIGHVRVVTDQSNKPLEKRVKELEELASYLEKQLYEFDEKHKANLLTLRRDFESEKSSRRSESEELKNKTSSAVAGGVKWELIGVIFFVLGPVDKLGSQISFDLIQSSFYGGYRGSFADGRYGVGVL